jgi:hypothetical protein
VLASDGVVLAAEKKMTSKLLEPSKSSEKMCGRRARGLWRSAPRLPRPRGCPRSQEAAAWRFWAAEWNFCRGWSVHAPAWPGRDGAPSRLPVSPATFPASRSREERVGPPAPCSRSPEAGVGTRASAE